MIELKIKPLSVNDAWQGRRFKTERYKSYTKTVLFLLPTIKLPEPPYTLIMEYYFSNPLSDVDNPCKPLQDILAKKYKFNDRDIKLLIQHKMGTVDKGEEKILIKILHYSNSGSYFATNIYS